MEKGKWVVVKQTGAFGLIREVHKWYDDRVLVQFGPSGPFRLYKPKSLRLATENEVEEEMT